MGKMQPSIPARAKINPITIITTSKVFAYLSAGKTKGSFNDPACRVIDTASNTFGFGLSSSVSASRLPKLRVSASDFPSSVADYCGGRALIELRRDKSTQQIGLIRQRRASRSLRASVGSSSSTIANLGFL
jgi:hypothetical protein